MSALNAFKSLIGTKPTGYIPAINPFLQIDVEALATELRLEERGKARGENELPPSDATAPDDIELEITGRVENEARQSFTECVNELRVIDNRLSGLDLLQRFSEVQIQSTAAIGEFQAKARLHIDKLSELRREVQQSQEHITQFKKDNGLKRPVQEAITGSAFWGVVIGTIALESALNSIFLRVNDDYGYLGGITIAFVIAFINVLIATMVGKKFMPMRNSIRGGESAAGYIGVGLYGIFAVGLNLLGAHYRTVKGAGADNPEGAAFDSLFSNPLNIDDFMSALLMVLGIACSVAALYAGYRSDDEYPGFGRVAREHERILQEYCEGVEAAQQDLSEIRNQATEQARSIKSELSRDRKEYDSALLSRTSILALYSQRQPYLQSVGNRLLGNYRNANRAARQTPAPAYFSRDWTLSALADPGMTPPPELKRELDDALMQASEALSDAAKQINEAFMRHIESFRQIDELIAVQ